MDRSFAGFLILVFVLFRIPSDAFSLPGGYSFFPLSFKLPPPSFIIHFEFTRSSHAQ